MKKLFIVLLFVSTVAQAQTYTLTDTEGYVPVAGPSGEIRANCRTTDKASRFDANATSARIMLASSSAPRQQNDTSGTASTDVEELKGRMMNDDVTMALIREMQNDPEMLAILNDPATLRALQAGDFNALTSNPAFLKLLNNPRVREIENRMQKDGTR